MRLPFRIASPGKDAASRFSRLRRLVGAIGSIAILGFVASSAFDAWRAHQEAILATHRELGNLAKALAEQGARSLQTADVLLRETAQWYGEVGRTLPDAAVDAALRANASGVRPVRSLTIADARGIQRLRSRSDITRAIDISDRSYFTAQRDGKARGLFVSEPILTRSEGHPTFVLSRRLPDREGRFSGIVTVIVDLEDIRQFYRAIDLGKGSAINLLRDDGTLILREPGAMPAPGQRFPELVEADREPGAVWVSRIDGTPRFVATVHLAGMPLVVTVTREKSVALAAWRDMVVHVAVRTLLVVLTGIAAIAALLRQLHRLEAGERALRVSEERYALAMDAANEGHWDWEIVPDRLFLSQKMRMLHGVDGPATVMRRADWLACIALDPDDAPRLEAAVREHLSGRTPRYECEYRVRHADGSWHWLLARGRCLHDRGGRAYRFVGSTSDVTGRKQAEAERGQLELELRQSHKLEAVGTLAGGIAHDFNNILGAILGYAELAHKHGGDGTVRRYLENVLQAAGRAKALVERILGFSRSGLAERSLVNAQSVVEEALELLAASLPEAIRIERRLDSGTAGVSCDPVQLHQVVMNLGTNAIQAMAAGGVLTVALERVECPAPLRLSHGTAQPGLYVKLIVSDTGGGMSSDVLARAFDPFFTTKGVGQGTGLGLSLVHGIVTDLQGAIDVATGPGRGTVVGVWLPLAGECAPAELKPAGDEPLGSGETVMIVDDEAPLAALAEEMLAQLGYEPVGYTSSHGALEAFRADPQRFDAVLTDEMMPGVFGTQLAAEIHRLRPELPVIVMSGHGDAQLAERAHAAGARAVLHKPLASREIAEALAAALARGDRAAA